MTISKAIQELKTGTCYECAYGTSAAYECSGENPTCPFKKAIHMAVDSLIKNQWIPVTEKLPEKRCEVLLSFRNGCVITGYLYSDNEWHDSGWEHEYNFEEVNAWKEIPEPYREAEK